MMEYVAHRCDSSQENTAATNGSHVHDLRTEDVSRISYQLLSAVAHCAKHQVIHRDIKPENTMFVDKSLTAELRLIDFGSGCIDAYKEIPDDGRDADGLVKHKTVSPPLPRKEWCLVGVLAFLFRMLILMSLVGTSTLGRLFIRLLSCFNAIIPAKLMSLAAVLLCMFLWLDIQPMNCKKLSIYYKNPSEICATYPICHQTCPILILSCWNSSWSTMPPNDRWLE
jgi:serine/threonine protein kinase